MTEGPWVKDYDGGMVCVYDHWEDRLAKVEWMRDVAERNALSRPIIVHMAWLRSLVEGWGSTLMWVTEREEVDSVEIAEVLYERQHGQKVYAAPIIREGRTTREADASEASHSA